MKSVFLDLDNTLTDRTRTIHTYAEVFASQYRQYLVPDLKVIELAEQLIKLDQGGYAGHAGRSEAIAGLNIWTNPVQADDLSEHWQNWVPCYSEPMEGLHQCLSDLNEQGYRLALVTNGTSRGQRSKIGRLKLEKYFHRIVISEEVGIEKPDQQIFELALELMDCKASEAAFVGDHPLNDYQGSKKTGMLPIWFRGSHKWTSDRPAKYAISHLSELLPLLSGIQQQ